MPNRIARKLPIFNFCGVIALQSFFMGLYLWMRPEKFDIDAYKPLFMIADKKVFAVALMAIGLCIIYGYVRSRLKYCRIGLLFFGIYYSMEAGGYITAFVDGYVSMWPAIKDIALMALCGVGAFSTFPYPHLEGK